MLESRLNSEQLFDNFLAEAKNKGWKCSNLSLGESSWRVSWRAKPEM